MAIDPATLISSFYAVLATDSAGASVRAALGAAGSSVISADDLAVDSLPARPFVALRAGGISGAHEWDVQRMVLTWWIYDDPVRKFSRIDALINLIAAAYPSDDPTVIASCDVRRAGVGQPFLDAKLGNRPGRAVSYQLSWR